MSDNNKMPGEGKVFAACLLIAALFLIGIVGINVRSDLEQSSLNIVSNLEETKTAFENGYEQIVLPGSSQLVWSKVSN